LRNHGYTEADERAAAVDIAGRVGIVAATYGE